MQIVGLRRGASKMAALLKQNGTLSSPEIRLWEKNVAKPLQEFGFELRTALHEGTVSDHKDFWQRVVNEVIERVAADEVVVRRIVGHHTLFAQVKDLANEVCAFSTTPMVKGYNRYRLVLAFCEALKVANHPRL